MKVILSILVLASFVFSGCENPEKEKEIPTIFFTLQGVDSQSGIINGENIVVSVQDASSLSLSGTCNFAEITVENSGSFKGSNLEIREAVIKNSGAGSIHVWVTDRLIVHIQGAGSVYYKGNPVIIPNISGAGQLIKY
jgi:hypothetical protein